MYKNETRYESTNILYESKQNNDTEIRWSRQYDRESRTETDHRVRPEKSSKIHKNRQGFRASNSSSVFSTGKLLQKILDELNISKSVFSTRQRIIRNFARKKNSLSEKPVMANWDAENLEIFVIFAYSSVSRGSTGWLFVGYSIFIIYRFKINKPVRNRTKSEM